MIPKIIHFCWLSDDEYPKLIEKCMATWKSKLPDYEFILWDTHKFDINSTLWTKQAFEKKKYAFAADYIRFYAIYNYGGIYLDTDVEVLKSFDDLLNLPYFIGLEQNNIIEAAVFGSEKGSDWVFDCLKYYENRSFIKDNGKLETLVLPFIMKSQIKVNKNIRILKNNEADTIRSLITDKNSVVFFPFEYFSAKNHTSHEIFKTKNTYTIHHFNNSWVKKSRKYRLGFKRKLFQFVGKENTERLIVFFGFRKVNKFLKGTRKDDQ